MWCVRGPDGAWYEETLSDTREDAEFALFDCMDEGFRTKYWKRPDGNGGSRAAQRRLGYRAVKCELVEVKR